MRISIEQVKGLHPGILIDRELKKRKLSKGRFSLEIAEYPQTLGAVLLGKRNMNVPLSLKIEKILGFDEGLLMTMQIFYDIKQLKERERIKSTPDLTKFRPAIFWDTDMHTIDWERMKTAVITRVYERGDEQEMQELIRFYGKETVDQILQNIQNSGNAVLEHGK